MGAAAKAAPALAAAQAPKAESAARSKALAQPVNPLWQRMAVRSGGGAVHAIQRKCKACEEEREEEDDSPIVQAKRVGPANDSFEREADSVAERVLHSAGRPASRHSGAIANVTPLPILQRKPIRTPWLQRMCADCEEEEEEPHDSTDDAEADAALGVVDAPGAGAPLSEDMRSRIEPVLGADLAGVRVHSDVGSQAAADSIGARAFTYGSDIHLGAGESSEDLGLMAHEATHVVQQGAAGPMAGRESTASYGPVDSPEMPGPRVAKSENQKEARSRTEAAGERNSREPGAEAAEGTAEPLPEAGGAGGDSEDTASGHSVSSAEASGAAEEDASAMSSGDGGAQASAQPEQSIARIESAPDSPLKTIAIAEMEAINADCGATDAAIADTVNAAGGSIREHFSGVRASIAELVDSSIAGVSAFVAERQVEVLGLVAGAIETTQSFVADTIEGARTAVSSFAQSVDGIVTGALGSVEEAVLGITESISSVLEEIPLPDLPGISTLREFIGGMISAAGGAVNGALGTVRTVIQSALAMASRLANSLLSTLGRAVNAALGAMGRAIAAIVRTLSQAFNRILNALASGLRRAVYRLIFPALGRLEGVIARQLGRLGSFLSIQVRQNRANSLQTLADSLVGGNDSGSGEATESTTSEADWIESIHEIGRNARSTNRLIAEAITLNAAALSRRLVTMLAEAVASVMSAIAALAAEVLDGINGVVSQIATAIGTVVQECVAVATEASKQLFAGVESLIQWVRGFVESPVDAIVSFGETVLKQLLSAAVNAVSSFVTGGELEPAPPPAFDARASQPQGPVAMVGPATPIFVIAPITAPIAVPITAPIVVPVVTAPAWVPIALAVAAVAFGIMLRVIMVMAIIAAVVVAVVVAIIVFVLVVALLWLLVDYVTRTRRRENQCLPCIIFTRTLALAPDGTPSSRREVGVNEQIQMVSLTNVKWAATGGTITRIPGVGAGIIWTAPMAAGNFTVSAIPVNPKCKPCTVTMEVFAPAPRSLSKQRELKYDDYMAGSGFEARVTLLPLKVSFARLETRQQAMTGTATGYYLKELEWRTWPYAATDWFAVGPSNIALDDTIGTVPPGTEGHYGPGTFEWRISQRYRAARTESEGDEFSVAVHTQEMKGKDGEEITSKEGVMCKRKPPHDVREDPLTAKTAHERESLKAKLKLNDRDDKPMSSLSVGGGQARVGRHMLVEFLTHELGGGSDASGQMEIYGFAKLPMKGAILGEKSSPKPKPKPKPEPKPRRGRGGKGKSASTEAEANKKKEKKYESNQAYVRGHLLNDEVGGPGEPGNLFPITQLANRRHESEVEADVKDMVNKKMWVVRYSVAVEQTSNPAIIEVDYDENGNLSCWYYHLDAKFHCEYSTYKLFMDDTVRENARTKRTIVSEFDEAGFAVKVRARGCPQMPKVP